MKKVLEIEHTDGQQDKQTDRSRNTHQDKETDKKIIHSDTLADSHRYPDMLTDWSIDTH